MSMQPTITSSDPEITTFEQIMRILYNPALMAPKASRWDCLGCRHSDLDSDGVPDGCMAPRNECCIRDDRRDPWGI
jgi:hypothetical protein